MAPTYAATGSALAKKNVQAHSRKARATINEMRTAKHEQDKRPTSAAVFSELCIANVSKDVLKDSELGSEGDIDGRRALSSLVIGGEADILTNACARLTANADRYAFTAADFHRILLASLLAHTVLGTEENQRLSQKTA